VLVHRRVLSASTAALALALALPAAAQTPVVHIDNFGQVSSTYYRGAQPKGHDYADLAAIGVKTLVNLTGGDTDPQEPVLARSAGLAYFQIPMTTREIPTAAQVAEFLKIVNDPANQPVYVHCVGGRHRTGVMTAVYRLTHDAWTADRAFSEMKHYKFGADFLHPEFKTFVYDYAAELAHAAPVATKAGSSSR
jgi:tyrosine-protein phosphatase SIW14